MVTGSSREISVDDIEICNYADDTTLYTCDQNLQNVVERLENVSLKVIKWFSDNYLKLNEDKCHFLALGTYLMLESGIYLHSA